MAILKSLLVFSFVIRILSQYHFFTYIKQKHGDNILRQCRMYEKLCIRKEKCRLDLKFLLTCKKEGLVPVFARPKLSINGDVKLKKDIA